MLCYVLHKPLFLSICTILLVGRYGCPHSNNGKIKAKRDEKTFCPRLLRGWMVYLRFNPGLWHQKPLLLWMFLFIYSHGIHVKISCVCVCVCRNAIAGSWKVYIFNTVRHITFLSVVISLFIIFPAVFKNSCYSIFLPTFEVIKIKFLSLATLTTSL